MEPASADDEHVSEIYEWPGRKPSRAPVYFIRGTGRRHPGDQYTLSTRQEEDIQGTGLIYQWSGRRHPGDQYTLSTRQEEDIQGTGLIYQSGRSHPGDQYTISTRQEEDIQGRYTMYTKQEEDIHDPGIYKMNHLNKYIKFSHV